MEQQQAIYAQGRTTPGNIVTNAQPGDSYHNFGLAFDVVPTEYKSLPNWNPSGDYWQIIGNIGKNLGLTWGGDFSTPDKPHFELKAAPLSELKAYWNKFQSIMPITITPTEGGTAIIVAIAAVWFLLIRPKLQRSGML
jgi:D-alanyl-D-alanine carboxypeptidase-like protein